MADTSVHEDRGVERARRVERSDASRGLSHDDGREIRDASARQSGQRAAREVSGNAGDDFRKVDPEARPGPSATGMQPDIGTKTSSAQKQNATNWVDPVLQLGDRRPEVADLQRLLNQIDPNRKLPENGIFGSATHEAVKAEQER